MSETAVLRVQRLRPDARLPGRATPGSTGYDLHACLEFRARDDAVRTRLARRLRQGGDPSDARWEIYVAQKRRFQRPSEVPPERLITIDAERRLDREAKAVLRRLRRVSPLSLPADG